MARDTLDDLFVATLGELYDAEAQLAVGLPVLRRATVEAGLDDVVGEMHQATCGHMVRLETIFEMLGKRASVEPCWSVAPLIVDAYDAARSRDSFARHTGIALALLSVLHLEIVRLQSLAAWAMRCDTDELADVLKVPLAEKVAFARRLAVYAVGADRLELDVPQAAGRTIN